MFCVFGTCRGHNEVETQDVFGSFCPLLTPGTWRERSREPLVSLSKGKLGSLPCAQRIFIGTSREGAIMGIG